MQNQTTLLSLAKGTSKAPSTAELSSPVIHSTDTEQSISSQTEVQSERDISTSSLKQEV